MTSQEPKNPKAADRDIPDTEVIVVSAPSPVFVDSTGRRSRLLRRLAYAFGALCMLYGGLISVSLAGGPVSSSAILPLPDLPHRQDDAVAVRPSPTPEPSVSTPPKARFIAETLPRRDLPFARDRAVVPRTIATPTRTPAARPPKSPTPAATTSRPVESTPKPSPSAEPSTSTTPQPTTAPPIQVPPAGGEGGGGPATPTTNSGGSSASGSGGSGSGGSGSGSDAVAAPTRGPAVPAADAAGSSSIGTAA